VRDPNHPRFERWTELAASGRMVGADRPIGRVTIARNSMQAFTGATPGPFRSILFEQHRQVEALGVQTISIDRSVGQDAATCTIVLINDDMQPYDHSPQGIDTGIARPGYRSFSRGLQSAAYARSIYEDYDPNQASYGPDDPLARGAYPTDWGYPVVGDEPGWDIPGPASYEGGAGGIGGADTRYNRGLLIPNRVVRTYQGYGSDNMDADAQLIGRGETGYVHPALDGKLVQTGVWMVDTVSYGSNGQITLTCRDLGKLLLTQVIYPPMVPIEHFPLKFGPPGTNEQFPEQVRTSEITDWSEAIKQLCAWAGFTWFARPDHFPGVVADPLLGHHAGVPMRVWGKFEVLGAGPTDQTLSDTLMLKTFAEAINFIKDNLGLIFFISDAGAATARYPNLLAPGNIVDDPFSPNDGLRFDEHPIEFHENANLLDYSVTLNDATLYTDIIATGALPAEHGGGAIAGGVDLVGSDPSGLEYRNILAGQTRPFYVPAENTGMLHTPEELQRFCELTAVKILFTYRKGNARIVAHPGLQLDDQVRIYDRVTHENNIHYVAGISSNMDLRSGEWVMDVTTHWLGNDPLGDWFANHLILTEAVMALPGIIDRLGGVNPGTAVNEQAPQEPA